MNIRFLKLFMFVIGLTLSAEYCAAKRVPGFIVTNNADTLFGDIKVYSFDRVTGVWIINGIDLQCYHFEVTFRNSIEKKYLTYKPEDIKGFGFVYKSKKYIFHRFILEPKNMFKPGTKVYRFLSLEHKGKISLYKDVIRMTNPSADFISNISNLFFDYYLYDANHDLQKFQVKDEEKSMAEILRNYGFADEYLKELPTKTNLRDIKMILEDYDLWWVKRNKGNSADLL
jgi:hypothetical protein